MTTELSVAAEDHLKVIWKATEWDDVPATTSALAETLGTTPASVSDMVRRLAERGLVEHQPYKPVRLTEAGRRSALRVVRRHRLLEAYLVAELGFGWDEVHDEAEALEHWVSDRLLEQIDLKLGRPEVDPHGDPIPRADGTMVPRGDVLPLSEAEPGRYTVSRLSDSDPGRLVYCAERGLVPGATVDVTDRDALAGTITVGCGDPGSQLVFGAGAASSVLVEPHSGRD